MRTRSRAYGVHLAGYQQRGKQRHAPSARLAAITTTVFCHSTNLCFTPGRSILWSASSRIGSRAGTKNHWFLLGAPPRALPRPTRGILPTRRAKTEAVACRRSVRLWINWHWRPTVVRTTTLTRRFLRPEWVRERILLFYIIPLHNHNQP